MIKNLIIGIDESSNIKELLDYGIRQFYFGYMPSDFEISLNRRNNTKEQYKTLEKIYHDIELIHKNNGTIYLALNHITSNSIMLEEAKKIFGHFKDKVDAIIVSTITMATFLKNQNYKNIVISNLFGNYSISSVKFLIDNFNPIKIILPRDMRLCDIEKIVQYFPNMNFECFLFGDGCRFSESFCFVDQGDYDLDSSTLCSYTLSNYQLVKKANVAFKMVVKDGLLNNDEKIAQLQTSKIDISTLIDNLFVLNDKFNSKQIAYTLHQLERYDIEEFYKDEILYIKAKTILKILKQFEKANEILTQLNQKEFVANNSYKKYHRTNTNAINQTINFFMKHKNIVSYKMPSRGRNIINMLSLLKNDDENYNYKESLYKL